MKILKPILGTNIKCVQMNIYSVLAGFLITAIMAAMISFGGAACNTGAQNQAVEIISVTGPIPPITPGGPTVEITLKNVSDEPVNGLTATLMAGRSYDFTFDVSPSTPLMPGASISQKSILIGGGFSDNVLYPLTIKATLQSGTTSVYTQQVQIKAPR